VASEQELVNFLFGDPGVPVAPVSPGIMAVNAPPSK
jgi:hypothetical protein